MREAFADREQGQAQAEDEEREPGYDEGGTGNERHRVVDRLPDDEQLKDADYQHDRQQVTHAVGCVAEQGFE